MTDTEALSKLRSRLVLLDVALRNCADPSLGRHITDEFLAYARGVLLASPNSWMSDPGGGPGDFLDPSDRGRLVLGLSCATGYGDICWSDDRGLLRLAIHWALKPISAAEWHDPLPLRATLFRLLDEGKI